jgi:hypothetical protein
VASVADYRVYQVGLDGHFVNFHALTCEDDGEAIERAQRSNSFARYP